MEEHKHESATDYTTFYLVRVWNGNRSWNEKDTVDTRGLPVSICKICGTIFYAKFKG